MDSTKIFIDTDNEITFVIEKILASRTEKVILVIPDRASLLSSITGLKLIRRVLDKSNKLLVIVTLDEIGAQLARKGGLCVVSRVGEINEEIWEGVSKAKFEAIKKNSRPHYMPIAIEGDAKKEHSDNKPVEMQKIDLQSLLVEDEINSEEVVEESEIEEEEKPDFITEDTIDLKKAAVPEIRINVEESDLERNEEEESPIVANETSEFNPQFLSKDTSDDLKKDVTELNIKETEPEINLKEEKEEMPKVDKTTRVRKKAPSSSGIANLSFAVGKDIGQKKN